MNAEFRDVELHAVTGSLRIRVALKNKSGQIWLPDKFSLGWQLFDPDTNLFIQEGEWVAASGEVRPGGAADFTFAISFPPETGGYQIYISPIQPSSGWAYRNGAPFLRVFVSVTSGEVRILEHEIVTMPRLRWRRLRRAVPRFFLSP